MTIFYSPEYSGAVYLKDKIMMDTVVVNTIGLVNLLELRLGIHYKDFNEQERLARYYNAVCKYMEDNPGNIMSKSFSVADLSTAEQMLQWRDELRASKWNFKGGEISERLACLVAVEAFFNDECDLCARIETVCGRVSELDCGDMTIRIPVDKALLRPTAADLVNALASQGAKVEVLETVEDKGNNISKIRNLLLTGQSSQEIELDPEDHSFVVWKFPDDRSACEYLAYTEPQTDVWINSDNKTMDNYLSLCGKPQSGSVSSGSVPQLMQLFVIGLGLFFEPLNINTLVEWLYMPAHPLPAFFRKLLASQIAKKGGYRNPSCKEIVEKYKRGDYVYLDEQQKQLPEEEQIELKKKDIKRRTKLVELFLPPIDATREKILTSDVSRFVTELSSWAKQFPNKYSNVNMLIQEQLMAIVSMCDSFKIVLESKKAETLSIKEINSLINSIPRKDTFTHAIALSGSRLVVDSPSKLASRVDKCIWIGVDGDTGSELDCSFLSPKEKKELGSNITLWDENSETTYRDMMQKYLPLLMTSEQLVLVVRERVAGEQSLKHPLMVMLENKIKNFDSFVETPKIDSKSKKEVSVIKREPVGAEMQVEKNCINWPPHLSPTEITTLLEYPFDYLMCHILNITNDERAQIRDIKATQGNVAHAVIEKLFSPDANEGSITAEKIKERLQESFDSSYDAVLQERGAVLLLSENKLTEKLLKRSLRKCLDKLVTILINNSLSVTACERMVMNNMELGLTNDAGDNDLLGYIDMTLLDRDGKPVVFDFKWTSSKKYYQSLLEENRSVQLELYRWMLGKEEGQSGVRVGYFVMPEGQLLSKDAFEGDFCYMVGDGYSRDIFEQIKRSIIYRKNQLDSGIVEMNSPYEEMSYVRDMIVKDLFPIKRDDNTGSKQANRFTKYTVLNPIK